MTKICKMILCQRQLFVVLQRYEDTWHHFFFFTSRGNNPVSLDNSFILKAATNENHNFDTANIPIMGFLYSYNQFLIHKS